MAYFQKIHRLNRALFIKWPTLDGDLSHCIPAGNETKGAVRARLGADDHHFDSTDGSIKSHRAFFGLPSGNQAMLAGDHTSIRCHGASGRLCRRLDLRCSQELRSRHILSANQFLKVSRCSGKGVRIIRPMPGNKYPVASNCPKHRDTRLEPGCSWFKAGIWWWALPGSNR